MMPPEVLEALRALPIRADAAGLSIPASGLPAFGWLALLRTTSLYFTASFMLQMGLDNLVGSGRVDERLSKWKGFASKEQFSSGMLNLIWVVGIKLMMMLQLFSAAFGFIEIGGFLGVRQDDAPFGSWGFACGVFSLVAHLLAILGYRWAKDYPAAAAMMRYINLALFTTLIQLPIDSIDMTPAAKHPGFGMLEMVLTGFVAAVFVQSGVDKVFDWSGNAGWLSSYFSDTLIAPLWFPGLLKLTVLELVAGFSAAVAVVLYQQGEADEARSLALISLVVMLAALAVVLTGMLFKKDHTQAGPVIPYVTFALCAVSILSRGF